MSHNIYTAFNCLSWIPIIYLDTNDIYQSSSSNGHLIQPPSSIVLPQRRIPNDAVKPSSNVLPPTSFIPSRISTASFISISCDQRRIVLQVFLSLLCFFILLLFRSLHFSCKKRYGELRRHNARLSNIIRLAPPLQVWAHRTYFFRLVAPKGSKFLIKW